MRGQSGIEFIVLIGFLIVVFLGFSLVIQQKILDQELENQRALREQMADLVERELLLAASVNWGYAREFELPSVLGGEPYNITLEKPTGPVQGRNTLVITHAGEEYLRFLSVNVTLITGIIATVDDNRIVDFSPARPDKVIVQKNGWGCIYINRKCVDQGTALTDCPVSTSDGCLP